MRRGVYILPNLFTTASMLCGFYAIIEGINIALDRGHDYERCGLAIIAAALLDGIDGRVARRTNTSSRFGREYDSLSDLISFGAAPAVLLYVWALNGLGRAGWLGCFLYLACAALRLARFNVQADRVEKSYFQGLPSPMAALMVASAILIWEGTPLWNHKVFIDGDVPAILLVMTYLLATLMVSTIPYRSFKTLHLTRRQPFILMFFAVVAMAIWAYKPWWVLFLMGAAYMIFGPIEQFILNPPVKAYRRVRDRRRGVSEAEFHENPSSSNEGNGPTLRVFHKK